MFIVAYGWAVLPGHHIVSIADGAAFAIMMICALGLLYAITLIMMTFSFWLIRLDNLMVLGDTVFGIARTPIDIFAKLGPAAVYVLSYVIPLAFLAALPVKELFGVGAVWPVVAQAILLAAAFLAAATLFWRYATRVYSSASS
jgi:ABC-2 type transport system permease protein